MVVITEAECAVAVMEGEWAVAAWEQALDQVGAGLVVVMEEALLEVVAALAVVAFVEGMWEFSPTTKS